MIVAAAGRNFEPAAEREIALELERLARLDGHEVDLLLVPLSGDPKTALDEIMAIRLMDLWDRGDRLIAIGAHACVLRHRKKVCWLPGGIGPRPSLSPEEELERRALARAIREASAVLAASRAAAAEALEIWNISCTTVSSSPPDAASQAESILKAVSS